jgi:cytochrome c556
VFEKLKNKGESMLFAPRHRPLLALTLAAIAAPLLAAPADQVRTRVAGFRELGASFKALNDGLRAPEPQTVLVQISARQIRNAATQIPAWFPAGSGPGSGGETAAKPEIWSDAPRFRQALDTFAAQADALQRAVASGNMDATRAAARSVGASCKGCHDQFRLPKD